jgi:hypothetical protein
LEQVDGTVKKKKKKKLKRTFSPPQHMQRRDVSWVHGMAEHCNLGAKNVTVNQEFE